MEVDIIPLLRGPFGRVVRRSDGRNVQALFLLLSGGALVTVCHSISYFVVLVKGFGKNNKNYFMTALNRD